MIDFHCHVDLYPDPRSIIRTCVAQGLYVLSVTNTPSAWHGTAALATGVPRVRTALGLHPQLASERVGELDLFRKLLPTVRYVGEIGLDGTAEHRSSWAMQLRVFNEILDACGQLGGRILSVHSRGAAKAVLDALAAHQPAGTAVLHWFSGTQRELSRALEMGCWFSVGPAMLVGAKGRALVNRMPHGRVVPESDGPFARVADHPLNPWDVEPVYRELGLLWGVSINDVRQQLYNNFRVLVAESAAMPVDGPSAPDRRISGK